MSKNTKLIHLACGINYLTSLGVSTNTELTELTHLDCRGNELTTAALNDLFRTLHSNDGEKHIL